MHPSPAISYELAQARITDLRHQARRESLARATRTAGRRPPVPGRVLVVHRRRVTAALS
jgi:hypothetical protein